MLAILHSVPRGMVPGVSGEFVVTVGKLTDSQAKLTFNLSLGWDIFATYVKQYSRFGA